MPDTEFAIPSGLSCRPAFQVEAIIWRARRPIVDFGRLLVTLQSRFLPGSPNSATQGPGPPTPEMYAQENCRLECKSEPTDSWTFTYLGRGGLPSASRGSLSKDEVDARRPETGRSRGEPRIGLRQRLPGNLNPRQLETRRRGNPVFGVYRGGSSIDAELVGSDGRVIRTIAVDPQPHHHSRMRRGLPEPDSPVPGQTGGDW